MSLWFGHVGFEIKKNDVRWHENFNTMASYQRDGQKADMVYIGVLDGRQGWTTPLLIADPCGLDLANGPRLMVVC